MSTDLGFAGGGGVGRSFTLQDLFSAVASQAEGSSATSQTMVLNESYQPEEGIAISDMVALVQFTAAQTAYNATTWTNGVWS